MKRLTIALLLAAVTLCSHAEETPRGKHFGLYLVIGDFDRRLLQGKGDWQKLETLAEPILSEQELISYDWPTHRLTLNTAALQQSLPRVPVGGLPFIVVAGGERIYLGAFTTSISSMSFAVPSLNLDRSTNHTVTLDRAYPTPNFGAGPDPRNDPRIKTALTQAGKLDQKIDSQKLAVTSSEKSSVSSHLTVTTNDVIRVEKPGVGTCLVQFTSFGDKTAIYRWRFKPLHTAVKSGTSDVTELVSDQSKTSITAGDITLAWSTGGNEKGYLYFYADREKATLLPAKSFPENF